MKKLASLCILMLVPIFSFSQNPGDAAFQSPIVHDINIIFSQPNYWDSLMYYKHHADSFGLSTQPMLADVIIDGTPMYYVGVCLKGNSSFWSYPGQKKSIKLSFNEYVSGQRYDGMKTIHLNNNYLDPTSLREKLMLDFLNEKGMDAPRCTYAKVSYNGNYVGLFKMVEHIDKIFLNTRYGDNDGNLFKGDQWGSLNWEDTNQVSYYNFYELHTNEVQNDWSDLVNLIDNINNTPTSDFYDTLEANLNTDQFIKQWAARNLFVDLDAYYHAPHNYYTYHNLLTDKFEWISWDMSASFGVYINMTQDSIEHTSILMDGLPLPLPLTQRMLVNTTYTTAYLNAICEYKDYLTNANLNPKIDSIANVIRPFIYAEPDSNQMYTEPIFEASMDTLTIMSPPIVIPGLKEFISNRHTNVMNELASISFTCTVGVEDLSDLELNTKVYPNPFTSTTTLEMNNASGNHYDLKISDIHGNEVHPEIFSHDNSFVINRSNLAAGLYFYQVKTNQQIISTGKFIIE